MEEEPQRPQINVSKIVSGGGIAGAIFAVTCTLIFFFGIPALRYFLPGAAVVGFVVAILIRFSRHETPGKPWILVDTDNPSGDARLRRVGRPGGLPHIKRA